MRISKDLVLGVAIGLLIGFLLGGFAAISGQQAAFYDIEHGLVE